MKIKKQNLTKAYFFVIFRQVCRFSVQWTPQHYIVYEACLNSNDIPKLLFDIVHRYIYEADDVVSEGWAGPIIRQLVFFLSPLTS